MNNVRGLWVILDLVFLVIFNAIFFLVGGTEHNTTVWISYAFIHFSYIMLLITPYLVTNSNSAYVFGFALMSVSASYFLIEFVVGLICIFAKPEQWVIPFIIQLIIQGLYIITLVSNTIANEHTADNEYKSQVDLQYIKNAAHQLKAVMDSTSDPKSKKMIEKVYDLIQSSPTRSHSSVALIEKDIEMEIMSIDRAACSNDEEQLTLHINRLKNKIAERNRTLQILN